MQAPINAPITLENGHYTSSTSDGSMPVRRGKSTWELVATGFAGLMLFITFVIACTAMGQVGDLNKLMLTHDHDEGEPMAEKSDAPPVFPAAGRAGAVCAEDKLRGARILTSPAGRHYQIVGHLLNKDSGYSWFEAQADAEARCYQGCPGTLATIPSIAENEFLHTELCKRMDCRRYDLQGVNQAWIGGTDLRVEGTWEWGPPEGATRRQIFYQEQAVGTGGTGLPVDGHFSNWRANEPNNNPASALAEEDCMYFDGDMTGPFNATWNDVHCYARRSWWIVDLSFRCEA